MADAEILDYLRAQFDRVHGKLDRLTEDVGEIRQRLTTLVERRLDLATA